MSNTQPTNEPGANKPKKKVKKKEVKLPANVDNAYVISQYYGFESIKMPQVSMDDRERADKLRKKSNFIHNILPPVEEPLAILRDHKDKFHVEEPQPFLFYCDGQARGGHKKKNFKPDEKLINLHVIGTPKSIAEALLIKTSLCILKEEGYKDISVEINHVGDPNSMKEFFKELKAYYRKNINTLSPTCQQYFKEGTHSLIMCKKSIDKELLENAPSPLNFLTDKNREHLKEVVEYLESQNIAYEINKDVIGDPHYSSDTVFTILNKENGKILATGSRYNNLSKKAGYKVETPGITTTLKLESPKETSSKELPSQIKSRFFFIQIGFDAKLKSLQVIEMLRQAKIPVYQSLVRDKMSAQIINAQKLQTPYILMMGQKEAKDETIVVREVATHQQTSVPIKNLITYLKKLK